MGLVTLIVVDADVVLVVGTVGFADVVGNVVVGVVVVVVVVVVLLVVVAVVVVVVVVEVDESINRLPPSS